MGVGDIKGSIARFLVLATVTAAIFAAVTGTASAAFSANPTRTFPIGTYQFGGYAPGFDGTFWTVATGASSGGAVGHVDDEGNNLGDGFSINDSAALGIAYYGGRVYIPVGSSFTPRIISYNTNGGDPIYPDEATGPRFGSNQLILRAYPSGLGTVALGQNNKVATLNLASNVSKNPWYPMAFHGNGVNDPLYNVEVGNAFETCSLDGEGIVLGEPNKYCGKYGYTDPGDLNSKHPGFNYPIDTAPGLGGLYVAELYNNRVTHINTVANPGATIDFTFGGAGTGASQLKEPYSVVVQPGTNDVFVSEQGNRRISVFDAGGHFISAFGYGVLDGSDMMQVCGIEIGPCQAGVDYKKDSRSYVTRLDFGPEGELLAYMPLTGQIQVFGVSGAPGSGGGGGGGGPAPGGAKKATEQIRLAASPIKVKKGAKTKLTAIVNRGKDCADRKVLFQAKTDRSWDNLGRAVKPGKGCKVSKKVKITAKSVFRAVLINSKNQATLGYSPRVTVKLK